MLKNMANRTVDMAPVNFHSTLFHVIDVNKETSYCLVTALFKISYFVFNRRKTPIQGDDDCK